MSIMDGPLLGSQGHFARATWALRLMKEILTNSPGMLTKQQTHFDLVLSMALPYLRGTRDKCRQQ